MLVYGSTPRFAPIGTDDEGRVYYALSPGLAERDAAAALIDGEAQPKRNRRVVGGVVSLDEKERESLTSWSWFLAVWGKKPAGAVLEIEEDEDDGEEKWWGFCKPQHIKELAQWITSKHGLDDLEEDEMKDDILGAAASSHGADSDAASSVGDATEDSSVVANESALEDDVEEEEGDSPRISTEALVDLVNGLHTYAIFLSSRIERGNRERAQRV